jgi:hypothetical protein
MKSTSGSHGFYQLSYRIIENGERTRHSVKSLKQAISVAGERVRNVVWTGWSMFHQFTRPEIAPRVVIDTLNGEEVEAIETDLREKTALDKSVADVWRITADGRATIIRPYREDQSTIPHLARQGLTSGKWLSPRTLIRELYELTTHAKELAKEFPNARSVEFRCTWLGLKGRKIADFEPGIDWDDRTCHADERTSSLTVSIDELVADAAGVVAKLATPVLNLFDALDLSREWIIREVPKFRTI